MSLRKVKKSQDTKGKNMFSKKEMENLAIEYAELNSQIKDLKLRKENIAETLKKGVTELGVQDDKGSFYIEGSGYIIGKVAKTKVSINNESAVKLLKKKGLNNCYSVKRTPVYTINEGAIEEAVIEGSLTEEEVQSFMSSSISYAVLVKKIEEIPEVEQTQLAAKSKSRKR